MDGMTAALYPRYCSWIENLAVEMINPRFGSHVFVRFVVFERPLMALNAFL